MKICKKRYYISNIKQNNTYIKEGNIYLFSSTLRWSYCME